MPVKTEAIGKAYEPTLYAVGREKIREYARAVGEHDALHLDLEAARAAGYADLIAPPMFAAVYSAPSVFDAMNDPDVNLDLEMLVHGAQEFCWGPLVVAGDEVETTTLVKDIYERPGLAYYLFESVSKNQRGEEIARGLWTNIVRERG